MGFVNTEQVGKVFMYSTNYTGSVLEALINVGTLKTNVLMLISVS